MLLLLLLKGGMYFVRRERKAVIRFETHHFSAASKNRSNKFHVETIQRTTISVEEPIVSIRSSFADVFEFKFTSINSNTAQLFERDLCGSAQNKLPDVSPQLVDCFVLQVALAHAQNRVGDIATARYVAQPGRSGANLRCRAGHTISGLHEERTLNEMKGFGPPLAVAQCEPKKIQYVGNRLSHKVRGSKPKRTADART